MEQIVIYLLMVQKRLWNCSISLVFGKHFKGFSVDSMKNTGLNEYVFDLSVNYDTIAVDDILDIHKYLMKKHDIK